MKHLSLFFCLLWAVVAQAQVKIGDNPQNIDGSSILELESTSKVLVITRVTTAQMDLIIPSVGALVYNTDIGCVHYYNGTAWINICDAVAGSVSFSSSDSTIHIAATDNNYDLTVGMISGDNIEDFSIIGRKLVDGDISYEKMGPFSVGPEQLRDEVIGDGLIRNPINGSIEVNTSGLTGTGSIISTEIDVTDGDNATFKDVILAISDGAVTAPKLANNAVTSDKIVNGAVDLGKLVAGTANGQLIQWNGTAWELVLGTSLDITEADGIVGNEVVEATLNGGLVRSGTGSQAAPYTLGIASNGITTNHLTNNVVTSEKLANDAVTTTKIVNGAVTDLKLAPNAVTSDKIVDGAVDLGKLVAGTANGQLIQWNGTMWELVLGTGLDITEADGIVGNEVVEATLNGGLVRSGTGSQAAPYTLGIASNGITTNHLTNNVVTSEKLANDAVTTTKIVDGAVTDLKLAPNAVTSEKIADNSITSAKIINGTILDEDISASAAIAGSKIVPSFTQDIVTTGGLDLGGDIYLNGYALVPDYVFQKYFNGHSSLNNKYRFQTLEEIEAFIKKNNHLPGIKSAEQVKKDGYWNLSESNLQNLEKIEELFLHTIEQEKKIGELRSENESLSTELKSIKKDLEEIKALLKNQ